MYIEKIFEYIWLYSWTEYVLHNNFFPKNRYLLLSNPNFHHRIFESFPEDLKKQLDKNELIYYYYYALNPNITIEDCKPFFEKDFIWAGLSSNPNITWEDVLYYKDKPWDFSMLSMNQNITFDIIFGNPSFPWNHNCLSKNPNLTIDIIKSHPEIEWNKELILRNPYIDPVDIIENKNLFNKNYLYLISIYNKRLKWELIKKYDNLNWHYPFLSFNENITLENVKNSCSSNWDYEKLTSNPNFDLNTIRTYFFGYKLHGKQLSKNINIDFSIVEENSDILWNKNFLSSNPMTKAKQKFINEKTVFHLSTKKNLFKELLTKMIHPTNMEKEYLS